MSSTGPLPVLIALPDDGFVRLRASRSGNSPLVIVPGTSVFASQLPEAVRRRLPMIYFRAGQRLAIVEPEQASPVVNLSSDADVAQEALTELADWLHATGTGCFNHPRAVLGTSRDGVATRLAGIPGLTVPRVIRLRPTEPDELTDAVTAAGIHWPVIVRVVGTHTGQATVRIDASDDVAAQLSTIPWGGRELYVTQYVDYRDDDGLYRKLRIAVVGGRAFLRHEITAGHWQLHAADHDARFDRLERALLEHRYPAEVRPRLQARMDAIAHAIGLDYFGIDCSMRPDGSLLLFECNATMDILYNSRPGVKHCDSAIGRIRDALVPLVLDPSRWRHPGRQAMQ